MVGVTFWVRELAGTAEETGTALFIDVCCPRDLCRPRVSWTAVADLAVPSRRFVETAEHRECHRIPSGAVALRTILDIRQQTDDQQPGPLTTQPPAQHSPHPWLGLRPRPGARPGWSCIGTVALPVVRPH